MAGLLDLGEVTVPPSEAAALVETLATSDLTRVECPDDLRVETGSVRPRPVVRISRPVPAYPGLGMSARSARRERRVRVRRLRSRCLVDAAGALRSRAAPGLAAGSRRRAARGRAAAIARRPRAGGLAVGPHADGLRRQRTAGPGVRVLVAEGWRVEAEGRIYRRPGSRDARRSLGHRLVRAARQRRLRRRQSPTCRRCSPPRAAANVRARWATGRSACCRRSGWRATSASPALGTADGDHVRFALVAGGAARRLARRRSRPCRCDEAFARVRRRARRVRRRRARSSRRRRFRGVLRDYQRDALGWFAFLRRFGFGGCLADEMGLGKTVMVLAALEARRVERERDGTSAASVAHRRAAIAGVQLAAGGGALRAGAARARLHRRRPARQPSTRFAEHDIVLTTYGTLRRDIGHSEGRRVRLRDPRRGAGDQERAAPARPRRRGCCTREHRLALSGTPVENHLGELWSLFDFLNPGHARRRVDLHGRGRPRPDARTRRCWTCSPAGCGRSSCGARRSRSPRELPARTEQTLYCELEPPQRALYDELRAHYRASLLGTRRARRAGRGRSCRSSRRCCACARRRAIPGLIDPRARVGAVGEARRAACRGCRSSSRTAARCSCSRSSRRCSACCGRGSTRPA